MTFRACFISALRKKSIKAFSNKISSKYLRHKANVITENCHCCGTHAGCWEYWGLLILRSISFQFYVVLQSLICGNIRFYNEEMKVIGALKILKRDCIFQTKRAVS